MGRFLNALYFRNPCMSHTFEVSFLSKSLFCHFQETEFNLFFMLLTVKKTDLKKSRQTQEHELNIKMKMILIKFNILFIHKLHRQRAWSETQMLGVLIKLAHKIKHQKMNFADSIPGFPSLAI